MLSKLIEDHISVDIGKMRPSDFIANQEQVKLKMMNHVQEGHGWKDVKRCPVCDSDSYEYEFEVHGAPLVNCTNCELRFHTKIPADLNDIYQASDYTVYT